VQEASFVDASLVPRIVIEPDDARLPGPRRAGWQASIRGLDLLPRLGQVRASTLVCVGKHDPQTPVRGNAEIAKSVADGRLAVFDRSGHSPFLEEPGRFQAVVGEFLGSPT
jgi:pimeloyl-ACP methyl ester carboxylesterase